MIARQLRLRRARTQGGMGHRGDEAGFTLVELLVVLVILPMIIGSVALAAITLINQTNPSDPKGVQARLLDSHDAQLASAYFVRDVASSVVVYPGSTMPQCGSGTELLGLWLDSGTVSYSAYQDPNPNIGWELVRYFCTPSGGSFALSSTTVVSHDVFTAGSDPASLACAGYSVVWGYGACANAASNGFVGFTVSDPTDCGASACPPTHGYVAANVTRVQETLQTYTSAYQFSLSGVPRASGGAAPSTTATPPPNPGSTTTTTLPQQYRLNPPFLSFGSVDLQNCSATVNGVAAVNSSASPSVTVGSNGSFDASSLYTTDTSDPSGAISPPQPGLSTQAGSSPVPDPYSSLTAPAGSTFGGYNVVVESDSPWKPSGSITGTGGGTIYIVQHGIKLSGNTGIVGNALLYIAGGNVDLTGGGNVSLSALSPTWESPVTSPAPPTLPEPVIWVPASNAGATISLGGNGNATTINGAVYAPAAQVSLSGGGNSGTLAVQGLVAGSYACNGHDSMTTGSTLTSGTSNFPSVSSLNYTDTAVLTDEVTVTGVGSLTPTGTVTIYQCGPSATTGCSSSTGTSLGTVALTPSGSGTATATTAAFHPSGPGSYCFAAYYSGSTSYNASADISSNGCFTVSAPQPPAVSQPSQGGCYNKTGSGSCSTWAGSISGMATDTGGPGMAMVQVAIQAPDGTWWNGASFAKSDSTVWNTATTTDNWATWVYAFAASKYPKKSTGTYTIEAVSTDTAGATSVATTVTYQWNG